MTTQPSGRSDEAALCLNCRASLTDRYCSQCGQARHEGDPPTIRRFFHDLTHEILHIDGKIGRTVKALLLKPGVLTQDYWSGRIVSWIRPIRLFLVAAALHLLFAPGTGPLNFRFEAFRRIDTGRLSLSAHWAGSSSRDANLAPLDSAESQILSRRFERAYLAIRYFSPLLFALFSWRLFRQAEPYFVRHLVGGLHFYALWYLLAIVSGGLGQWHSSLNSLGLASSVYLLLTVRRLYSLGWRKTLVKTVALFLALMAIESMLALLAMSFAITGQR